MNTINDASQQLQLRYINRRFSLSVEEWPHQPKYYTTLAFIYSKGKHTDAVRFTVTQELAVAGKINTSEFDKHSELNVSMTKNISDIFLPIKHSDGSFVDLNILIEGGPGIGKTVLAKEIAYQWAKTELLTSKKLLLLVFLRECHQTQLKSIENFVQIFFKNDKMIPYLTEYLLQTDGKDTVIVFDGFDELSAENKKESIMIDIINRRILTKCYLVVTSRSTALSYLHGSVDRRIEIVGFTEEDRLDYIQSAFRNSDDQVRALQHYLQSNPTINALCYIPLNMTVLLCLAEEGIDTLPKTQTEMYEKFIEMTTLRFLRKHEGFNFIVSINNLPAPYFKVFTELAKLAYKAFKADKIVFTISEIEKVCPNLTMIASNWNGLGLLKAVQYVQMGIDQVRFHFLHFSIQEYMAAWYISTLSDNEQIRLLKETFWEYRYYNIWIMYVGITCGSSFALRHFLSDNRLKVSSRLFNSSVVSKRFIKNKIKCLHLFQCLIEANKGNVIELVGYVVQNNQIDLSNQILLPRDLYTLTFFLIRSLNKNWDQLNLSNCNIGNKGIDILCNRLLSKSIVTIKTVIFSHNQLNCSSIIRLFDLFKCWHTSEIIITDDTILDSTTDIEAIENIILQSSTVTLVYIGSYLFSKNLLPSKILHVLSNTSSIKSIYLLNCSWTLHELTTSELLSLLEKQKLDRIRIISSSLDKNSIKRMILILLNKSDSVNMLIYDSTMSDEIGDEISSLISSSYKDISGVMLVVSANKVQGIVNTSTLSSKLSAVELFNLNTYVKHPDIKMCQWIENVEYCNKNITIDTFTKMLHKINMKGQLTISLLEDETLILHKVKFSRLVHPTNSVSVIYLSDCDVTKYDSIIKKCSTVYVFENSQLKLVSLHSDTQKHELESATHFINKFNNITTLNTIKIINFGISEETAGDLANVLYHNTQLQEIYLNGNNLQTVSVIEIFKGLKAVSALQVISISKNNITNEAADDIAAVFSCNMDIQELNLGGNDLRMLGIIKIAKGLQKNSSLKKLFIDHNNITDEAADDIAAGILCNSDLQELNIGNNKFSDLGAIVIAKALQKISKLTKLHINHNNITDKAADDIGLAIHSNVNLQEVDISKNNFHEEAALKIASFANHLTIGINFHISWQRVGYIL